MRQPQPCTASKLHPLAKILDPRFIGQQTDVFGKFFGIFFCIKCFSSTERAADIGNNSYEPFGRTIAVEPDGAQPYWGARALFLINEDKVFLSICIKEISFVEILKIVVHGNSKVKDMANRYLTGNT